MSQTAGTPNRLQTSGLVAVTLFILDAFVMNQGLLASVMLVVAIFNLLPIAIYHQVKYGNGLQRYIRCGIYASAAFLVFGANYANNRIAEARALELIRVIDQYHAANAKYPGSLEELVPSFIDKVPRAKFTLLGEFQYYSSVDGTTLLYMDMPPFGRPLYDFEKKSWDYLD